MTTKKCTRCKEEKPANVENFSTHPQTKNGLHPWCRECHREYSRVQREKRPFTITCAKAKNRAKERGLDFNIDVEYLGSIWTGVCPVLDIPIEIAKGNRKSNYDSASLDRIFPDKGYVKGNVAWISMRANLIKQNATSEEVRKVYVWMEEQGL